MYVCMYVCMYVYLTDYTHACPCDKRVEKFLLKISNFLCHGNKRQSRVNFDGIVKFNSLENPVFGAKFLVLSLVFAEC